MPHMKVLAISGPSGDPMATRPPVRTNFPEIETADSWWQFQATQLGQV